MTRPRLRVIDGGRQDRRQPARRADPWDAFAEWLLQWYGRVPPDQWPPPETWPIPPRLRAV